MKKMIGATILALFLGVTGAYPKQSSRFEGLIIFVNDTTIEIKRGNREITLNWSESSKIMRDGKDVGREAVQVCQKVSVVYGGGEGRNEVLTLVIMRESYCTR